LTLEDLSRAGTVFQIGLPPRRIDVLTSVSGLTFAAAWRTRVKTRFGRLVVSVLGRSALIRNKKAAGRPRDLLDVKVLARSRRRRRR
jgi:hypothetical protein